MHTITTIPPELLSSIFTAYTDAVPDAPTHLAAVCSAWHALVERTPRVWTHLHVRGRLRDEGELHRHEDVERGDEEGEKDDDDDEARMVRKAQKWFAMSGVCSVHVHVELLPSRSGRTRLVGFPAFVNIPTHTNAIVGTSHLRSTPRLAHILRRHVHRITVLEIRADSTLPIRAFLTEVYAHTNVNVSLDGESEDGRRDGGEQRAPIHTVMPALRSVILRNMSPDAPDAAPPPPRLDLRTHAHALPGLQIQIQPQFQAHTMQPSHDLHDLHDHTLPEPSTCTPHLTSVHFLNLPLPNSIPWLSLTRLTELHLLRGVRARPISVHDILDVIEASPGLKVLEVGGRIREAPGEGGVGRVGVAHAYSENKEAHAAGPISGHVPGLVTTPNVSAAPPYAYASAPTPTPTPTPAPALTPTPRILPLPHLRILTLTLNNIHSLLTPLRLPSLSSLTLCDLDGHAPWTGRALAGLLARTPLPPVKMLRLEGVVGMGKGSGVGAERGQVGWCLGRVPWVERVEVIAAGGRVEGEVVDALVGIRGRGGQGEGVDMDIVCPRLKHLVLSASSSAYYGTSSTRLMAARLAESRPEIRVEVVPFGPVSVSYF